MNLFSILPSLWNSFVELPADEKSQDYANGIFLLGASFGSLSSDLRRKLLKIHLANLGELLLKSTSPVLRFQICACLLEFAVEDLVSVLNLILPWIFEKKQSEKSEEMRLGFAEFAFVLSSLDSKLIGAVTLLSVSAMKMMADPLPEIRRLAAIAFGNFVKLMPLEVGTQGLPGFSDQLVKIHAEQMEFVQLLAAPNQLQTVK